MLRAHAPTAELPEMSGDALKEGAPLLNWKRLGRRHHDTQLSKTAAALANG
jgi:hypothetical protein